MGCYSTETFTYVGGSDKYPENHMYHIPIPCQHCANPTCVSACPYSVFGKRTDGIVTVGDTEKCKACQNKPCISACPYSVIDLDPVTGKASKCDFCVDLIDQGKAPACTTTCLTQSYKFGDLDDPDSEVSQIVKAWEGYVHQLKPESGNGPSVYYLLSKKQWRDMEGLYSPAWHD
ncbi:MAG: 4Fe-4S dicluster domain-containing protein [Coriobacteriia bacterium]